MEESVIKAIALDTFEENQINFIVLKYIRRSIWNAVGDK